ncbi:hypothetical protein HUS23_09175 [Ectothiorhodospiraceae bacterium 2226]|nr:hypothetical protein HUS23_09175 [Ectothiorhodospiraceae bacterium 2226]
MSFIKLFPLTEEHVPPVEHFGKGHPARCRPQTSFEARECWLNVHEIAAFEECPLYLVTDADPNALVDGIRLRLRSGESLLIPDDAADANEKFLALLARAVRGELVEMRYSSYLSELARRR